MYWTTTIGLSSVIYSFCLFFYVSDQWTTERTEQLDGAGVARRQRSRHPAASRRGAGAVLFIGGGGGCGVGVGGVGAGAGGVGRRRRRRDALSQTGRVRPLSLRRRRLGILGGESIDLPKKWVIDREIASGPLWWGVWRRRRRPDWPIRFPNDVTMASTDWSAASRMTSLWRRLIGRLLVWWTLPSLIRTPVNQDAGWLAGRSAVGWIIDWSEESIAVTRVGMGGSLGRVPALNGFFDRFQRVLARESGFVGLRFADRNHQRVFLVWWGWMLVWSFLSWFLSTWIRFYLVFIVSTAYAIRNILLNWVSLGKLGFKWQLLRVFTDFMDHLRCL